jgi:hypothetical protein
MLFDGVGLGVEKGDDHVTCINFTSSLLCCALNSNAFLHHSKVINRRRVLSMQIQMSRKVTCIAPLHRLTHALVCYGYGTFYDASLILIILLYMKVSLNACQFYTRCCSLVFVETTEEVEIVDAAVRYALEGDAFGYLCATACLQRGVI